MTSNDPSYLLPPHSPRRLGGQPWFPDTHHYIFDLTVGINSALTFSAGKISTLFVDALFALDEQGLLFPGVTVPEDRLRMAGMELIGYQRFQAKRADR
jgi:hypothetical protein